MAGKKETSSRRIPEDKAATPEEIASAIELLTDVQSERVEQYAHAKVRGLGRRAQGKSGQDLMQEAMMLTLSGDRRWNKSVTFPAHLLGVIRSTAWNWGKKFDEDEARLESELVTQDCEGNEQNPFLNAPSTHPSPERITVVNDLLDRVQPLLKDDQLASQVFEGLRGGLTGPDIQEILGIAQDEFDAKVKKIYRRARSVIM